MTITMNVSNIHARRVLPAVALIGGLSLVAACGSGNTGGSHNLANGATSSVSAHNTADVAFATDMIPHHAQAVEMADMALRTATDPEIKALAAAIKGAQDPEIVRMTGWLTSWRAPVPATGSGHMSGGSMIGMMSDADMASLGQASGAAFNKLWVDMMTRHHQGAITMATTELTAGQSADAKALARQIITAQTGEIARMATIAKRLG